MPVPGDGRDDWKILCALSEVAGAQLPYDSIAGVRERLAAVAPHMGEVKAVEAPLWLNGEYFKVQCPTFQLLNSGCNMQPRNAWHH